MRKLLALVLILTIFGCMPFVKKEFTQYSYNGKQITIGMNATNIRELIGPPTKISMPDAINRTLFPGGVYDNMTSGQQYWQYGSHKNGDKLVLSITFTNGIVTEINTFEK